MAQTNMMRADEIASGFNGVTDRKYWRANIAGTRVNPEVNFNSRASMVCVTYRIATGDFTMSFSKTDAAFGDFLASAHRSLTQVLASLVAAGLPFAIADDANLRIEYDPRSKGTVVMMAPHGDPWPEISAASFKVPERINLESPFSGLDGL